ncbi:unnamed protein product [Tetraodon nigroviridis]|uniref:(spotted green pufferfish) hypothetical protein n=1 Tax=Tetraodon nigroviridis TaxID=99883 RepID=Q4SAR2_TETNG|nr:unnamed protein product [Tetraodon nigroviridis]
MLSCLLSEKPCLQHLAEVYRNSWWRLIVEAAESASTFEFKIRNESKLLRLQDFFFFFRLFFFFFFVEV